MKHVLLVLVTAVLTLVTAGLVQHFYLRANPPPQAGKDFLDIKPLTPLKLDTKGITPGGYKKDYQFKTDWFTEHTATWEKCLEHLKGKPDVHYLEVGLFEGRSAFWVLENILTHPTARLTGIDPFFKEGQPPWFGYEDRFFANLKMSGFEDKCNIIRGFSQTELRKLPLESFDIIYIDGSHDAADCLEDAILSWRLLKDGGFLIFDDYLLHTKGTPEKPNLAIDAFCYFLGKHFDMVHVDWQAIMKKKASKK